MAKKKAQQPTTAKEALAKVLSDGKQRTIGELADAVEETYGKAVSIGTVRTTLSLLKKDGIEVVREKMEGQKGFTYGGPKKRRASRKKAA